MKIYQQDLALLLAEAEAAAKKCPAWSKKAVASIIKERTSSMKKHSVARAAATKAHALSL